MCLVYVVHFSILQSVGFIRTTRRRLARSSCGVNRRYYRCASRERYQHRLLVGTRSTRGTCFQGGTHARLRLKDSPAVSEAALFISEPQGTLPQHQTLVQQQYHVITLPPPLPPALMSCFRAWSNIFHDFFPPWMAFFFYTRCATRGRRRPSRSFRTTRAWSSRDVPAATTSTSSRIVSGKHDRLCIIAASVHPSL